MFVVFAELRPPWECNMCCKVLTSKASLVSHLRTHTGEKPYVCTVCEKAFSQKGTMERHQKGHSGQKPHRCQICGAAYTQRHNLNYHMQHGHHAELAAELVIRDDQIDLSDERFLSSKAECFSTERSDEGQCLTESSIEGQLLMERATKGQHLRKRSNERQHLTERSNEKQSLTERSSEGQSLPVDLFPYEMIDLSNEHEGQDNLCEGQ